MNNDKLNLSVRASEVHNNPRSPLLSEKIRYNYGKQQWDDHPPAGKPELTTSAQQHHNGQGPVTATGAPVNVYVQQEKRNPLGTAGFVIALITLFLGWIPVLGWILWTLGAIFSTVGIFKKPRGLAITGFILSFIDLIIILTLAATIIAIF